MTQMELGVYTFAEVTPGAQPGTTESPAQRLRDLIEEIELADERGLDVFGVGEHHRPTISPSPRRPSFSRRRRCARRGSS